jgi:drug/metabolite transporter (DMT)-like permease
MIQAIIAALFGAAGDVTNKKLLGELKVKPGEYLSFVFLFITIISLFLSPLNFHLDSRAFALPYIALFLLMVGVAVAWNLLIAKSLQSEPLHEYESIILLIPLFTVLLASVFIPGERNLAALIAGLVSSGALLFARFKNHHFVITKNVKRTGLAVLLVAIESICLRFLLDFYSPTLLYFIRVLIMSTAFLIYFKPDFGILKIQPILRNLIISAFCGTGLMVLKYYGFQQIGVVRTTIVLLLGPITTMAASYFYLGEHRNFKRDAICAAVVIACIVFAGMNS